ncbi:DNA-binding response regulator [Actinomycetota bacterium]|nr:DNA-binding response regulator [Actinomycetota bacterium]
MLCYTVFIKGLVAVVDDEEDIRYGCRVFLENAEFEVAEFEDGSKFLDRYASDEAFRNRLGVVILDIMMGKSNGGDILKRIRQIPKQPSLQVIMFSAIGDCESKVEYLDLGADDFLDKTASSAEFISRVKARFRNINNNDSEKVILNKRFVDNPELQIITVNNKDIGLTAKEYSVMSYLVNYEGAPVSKKEIERKVFGFVGFQDSNSVNTIISRIRSKIQKVDNNLSNCIIVRKGFGWVFLEPESVQ